MTDSRWCIALATLALGSTLAEARPARPPGDPALLPTAIERRLHSDDIDASSFLWNDWNKFVENYHPNYAADDDPSTAWVEGAKGSGAGAWLRVQTTPLEHTTRVRLRVRNGYQKSKDLFRANARAKDVAVRLAPSGVVVKASLADRDGWQEIVVDQPDGVVRTIELTVASVYEGTKYEDLCLSDLQVFATSRVADNPAFEKAKRQRLMEWRAARLATAAMFKSTRRALPLYPAYEIAATDIELGSDGGFAAMIEAAKRDPAFAKEFGPSLARAADVAAHLDDLPRAQVAPASRERLVATDGLQRVTVADIAGGEPFGFYDEGALRLPMLDYVSTLFADQLRMLDVKDPTTVTAYTSTEGRCPPDLTWVRRSEPKEKTGPAQVEAIVVGKCARVAAREGSFYARALELYVYDANGRLALSLASGHIDGFRWSEDGGRPMLAGGIALLTQGKRIEAKKRDAVAAR